MLINMSLAMLLSAAALSCSPQSLDLPRRIGKWDATLLGNHRIVIHVSDASSIAVRVHIPWRRRDKHPELIDTVVTDETGHRVQNVYRKTILREFGDLAFEPTAGAGTYFLYHLPHITHGSYYPSVEYTTPAVIAGSAWSDAIAKKDWIDLPEASAERFESVSELDAFTPMEVIASPTETEDLLRKNPASQFLVFPEDRHLSIRMWDDLPYRWAERGANTPFEGAAKRGEYYAFQLGVWAARTDLESVNVSFTALKSATGQTIKDKAITCYNTSGVDYRGIPFTVDLKVSKGKIQPLWCGIDIAESTKPGTYSGIATVTAKGESPVEIPINLKVENIIAKDHGDNRPEDMTRLRWLNSTLGQTPEIVKPFQSNGPLGSRIELSDEGFLSQVTRSVTENKVMLLAAPMRLDIEGESGTLLEKITSKPSKKKQPGGAMAWSQASTVGPVEKHLFGSIQFDGTADFQVELRATEDCDLKDIRLDIPVRKEVARYLMGLGRSGGKAPESLDWTWNVENNQEGAWIGDVDAGLLFALRDDRYVRPLNTNFYHEKPLIMPTSWDNGGKGGIHIRSEKDAYRITCYSGPRTVKKGEVLHFNVHMILTPSKPIDPHRQFSERYYHAYKPLSEIQRDGANVVNIHHATEINPWINYPFIGLEKNPGDDSKQKGPAAKMKAYIADAHKRGMKVKIYDTIRELSNRCPELFVLKSLGHEVFSGGKGGGGSWLREHLDDDYIAAWHATEVGDAAIVNSGMSRWHNYYVEGLDWLARNVGIDGLYLDDVAFDRTTMIRVRRVLEKRIAERTPTEAETTPNQPIIDLHSANQHNERDGWNNSAVLYMDLMPFLDRLWFGEYFKYDEDPYYWLVEVSGIPFGLMGEMLQDGGNPWRGMLFGMTARRPWAGDPRAIWKFWDDFGIKDSTMIGWWTDHCPVTTGNKHIAATVYIKKGQSTLISIASWEKETTSANLKINWKALGIDPKTATLVAKKIDKFQPAQTFKLGDAIPVEPGKGWLLVLSGTK
jgi:hypothetical protein